MIKSKSIYLFVMMLLLLHIACWAQLINSSPKKKLVEHDSVVLYPLIFSDTLKESALDSSMNFLNRPQNEPNFLIRLGICAASALAYKPGGSPALCNIVPPVKRW